MSGIDAGGGDGPDFVEQRDLAGRNAGGRLGPGHHFAEVAYETETGDIRERVNSESLKRFGRGAVECGHGAGNGLLADWAELLPFPS